MTATEHEGDAVMNKFERFVYDPTVYLKISWKKSSATDADVLRALRTDYTLGVLMRRGVPEWLGADAHSLIWRVASCADILTSERPRWARRVYRRVFGEHVPERCVRIPSFGGWYRPDQHAALSSAQLDAATRLLVALALDNTDVPYAPQLPDLCLLLLRHLDEHTVFCVVSDMLRQSRLFERSNNIAAGIVGAHDDSGNSNGVCLVRLGRRTVGLLWQRRVVCVSHAAARRRLSLATRRRRAVSVGGARPPRARRQRHLARRRAVARSQRARRHVCQSVAARRQCRRVV
eukprot:TRINITY_DN626_c0_g1_i3.p2 TRINITY_DN626_c0_g1~~TRINITY_DN626_c0_g1_i3.p2  ORF type:complete len:290 (-),score=97.21 TRINITY_DN626_c0_g1_i3:121-990(-)